jgi:general secretion pathway protein C
MAQMTWRLFPAVPRELAPAMAAAVVETTAGPGSSAATKSISDWHLLGRADEVVAPPPQAVVPETTLQLELRGILASADPTFARAIIAEPSREENSFAVGATLPGGATLKEILADHIVLSRGGRLETLRLPKDKLSGGAVETATRPSVPTSSAPAPSQGFTGSESLGELRDAMMNDPQLLAGLLQAEPVQEADGMISGFRLGPGQDPRLLRRFGLQRGDVVTAINDIRLDAMGKVPQLLQTLPTATELRVEFKRNGKPRSVTLNLQ